MHYTDEGRFIGAELQPDERLSEYQQYRDLTLANAVPFGEYSAD